MTTAKKASAPKTDRKSSPVAAPASPPASGVRAAARDVGPAPSDAPETTPAPTHDAIATRAFALYQARGAEHGSALEDWLRAEAEMRAPTRTGSTPRR